MPSSRNARRQSRPEPDDLILFINGRVASSSRNLADELTLIDRIDPIPLTVQRGIDLLEVTMEPEP
jgi:S1-C subfamily serine protease